MCVEINKKGYMKLLSIYPLGKHKQSLNTQPTLVYATILIYDNE
jgi:hypothetical protein